ncbi:GNAT family N-acetyltransferase [Cellulomonas sp. NPDC089187]|uniref:GNAT family N-acetyltransferase n=1 Tax=Cellulomonas sp. NPDC089187 TaxID=3154970 RepID=UPI003444D341
MVSISAPTGPDDVAAVAALLAEGFAVDPLITAVLPGTTQERQRRLRAFYRAWLSHREPGRVVDLARRSPQDEGPNDGEIVGVAIWHAPGAHDGRTPLGLALRVIRALGWRGARSWSRMEAAFGVAQPGDPHWYLSDVVVSDRARGEGVGSALLGHRLARLDADGAAAYLEATTPGSRRMYERLGFESRGPVVGLPGDQIPPEGMWRAPVTPR